MIKMLHNVQVSCFRCLQASSQQPSRHVCIRSVVNGQRFALAPQVSCSSSSSSSSSKSVERAPDPAPQSSRAGAQRIKSSKQGTTSSRAARQGIKQSNKPKQSPRRPKQKPLPTASTQAQLTTSTSSSLPTGIKLSPFTNVRFKSFQQLQHLVWSHGSSARIADITAMMSRLKLVAGASPAGKAALLGELWQLLQPQLQYAAARHCAEAMLAASKLGHCPDGLYEACLKQFVSRVRQQVLVHTPVGPLAVVAWPGARKLSQV